MIMIYLVLCACLGISILLLLNKIKILNAIEMSVSEKISSTFAIGFLIFTVYMFLIGLLDIEYSNLIFLPLYLNTIFIVVFGIRNYKKIKMNFDIKDNLRENIIKETLNILLTIAIFIMFILFITSSLSNFLTYPDEFSHWGIQAKNIFLGKRMNTFTPTGIETYPNFLPLLYSGYYFLVGSIQSNSIRILSAIFCILTYVNGLAICNRRGLDKNIFKFLFLVFLVLYPTVLELSSSAYADIAFMFFYSFSILYLLEWLGDLKDKTSLLLSILYLVGATWTKVDGFYLSFFTFVFLLFMSIVYKKINIRTVIRFTVVSLSLITVWKIYTNLSDFPDSFPIGVGSPFKIRLDYFIPMSIAIRDQILGNYASIVYTVLLIISFYLFYFKMDKLRKTYIISIISFILINVIFLIVCYLTKFGAEGIVAASFSRYITRIIPITIICILEFLRTDVRRKDYE